MTTRERIDVRDALLKADFRRYYEEVFKSVYTEVWVSNKDCTKITIEWDNKTNEEKTI